MRTKAKTIIPSLIALMSLAVAASAQEVTFSTPSGSTVTTASLRGRVVVLLFGGTQDPQCRDEFKALGSLSERYRGKPVNIYWVSVDPASVGNDKLNSPCGPTGSVAVLRDESRAAFKQFSGKKPQLPTIVVLNQQGQLQGPPRGGFNPDSDLINELAAVIDGLLTAK
ncbi:MAG TPA: TlpA disulfide reductase family protein [Blastocatellia bacterium]|nr:TlpA disulfide reductase family protein [Blastocatellia bacterium]